MISRMLSAARAAAGMTQGEVAERAGTSAPTVSAYENGHKTPRADVFLRLLRAMGRDIAVVRREPATTRIMLRQCQRLAEIVAADPDEAVRKMLAVLDDPAFESDYAEVWRQITAAGAIAIIAVLTSNHRDALPLLSDCPLWRAGLLPDQDRLDIIEQVRAA